MSADRYRRLESIGTGQLREKASRFMAIAFPMSNEADFEQQLQTTMKEHHGARHFCTAWVLGEAGERYRANDAGEPSGTAGKPILNRIQAMGLTYCGVIVVRYFGGTLLGKAGLIQAYGEAAQLALADAPIVEHVVRESVLIKCTYPQLEAIRRTVLAREGEVIHIDFSDTVVMHAALPRSTVPASLMDWAAQGIDAQPYEAGK